MNSLPNDPNFLNPPAKYRGAPFWAWNSALDREQLLRQIEMFREMGFGGFHMHSRTGLTATYMGEEFLARIRDCVGKAHDEGMLAWLYDEDRWPSGFAGGMVTCSPAYRMRHILFTPQRYCGLINPPPNISCAEAGRLENGKWLASYSVQLREGNLHHYRRLKDDGSTEEEGRVWHAYLEFTDGVPWFNDHSYVDVLNPKAIQRFVQLTHEIYKHTVGEQFGNTIPAIFTDEPQHVLKGFFESPHDLRDLVIPATDDFFATFQETFEEDLLDALPEVFWELPDGAYSRTRYRYHEHVTERFSQAFAGTLGQWCDQAGIMLTGHMMEERTLQSQTRAIGDAMRSLAHFQLPGIDILIDQLELTTAKQAQSISRQYGRTGVLSELYGATGWDFKFSGYKAQGDWQAALGINIRVPHLSWLSMEGESKRDFPASIHYQSPWWREFRLLEDHFARVNVYLSKGRPVARVAVIHPIESLWLCYGNWTQTGRDREMLDKQFLELPEWLLFSLIDFDYLCEALLPKQSPATGPGWLKVGHSHYEAVIVPGMRTIRESTLQFLEEFVAKGGTLIFAGEVPQLVDASRSDRANMLAKRSRQCDWDRDQLVKLLDNFRDLRYQQTNTTLPNSLLYQLREDGQQRHLFICNTDRTRPRPGIVIEVDGEWRVLDRDTTSGKTTESSAHAKDGKTSLRLNLEAHGHRLLTLIPGTPKQQTSRHPRNWIPISSLVDTVPVTLEEPNVLLLDQAEWRLNGGPWNESEEILRIGSSIHSRIGLPEPRGFGAQPWTNQRMASPIGRIDLRFTIQSEIRLKDLCLGLEQASAWSIHVDGNPIPFRKEGWWVDEAIETVALSPLEPGTHVLMISRQINSQDQLEWCYLLGSFGVRLNGHAGTLISPIQNLRLGDWTKQSLPFYTGNLTYHFPLNIDQSHARCGLRFPECANPLLKISLDDAPSTAVAFAPFRYEFPEIAAGEHQLQVKAYGNRHNAFGPVHNSQNEIPWMGPDAWRTSGDSWTYQYNLRPMGLLTPPILERNPIHA